MMGSPSFGASRIDGQMLMVALPWLSESRSGDHHVYALADLRIVAHLQLDLNVGLPQGASFPTPDASGDLRG